MFDSVANDAILSNVELSTDDRIALSVVVEREIDRLRGEDADWFDDRIESLIALNEKLGFTEVKHGCQCGEGDCKKTFG
jgi:hypothetical protein